MKRALIFMLTAVLIIFVTSDSDKNLPVMVESDSNKKVIIGGEHFGIKMFSKGVIVVGVEDSVYGCDIPSPALKAGIKKNDIIKSIDNTEINSNEQIAEILNTKDNEELYVTIERNGKEIVTKLTPQSDSSGIKRAGIWVKDSAAGIGTVTYYDYENGTFGALGHGVCEAETGALLPLNYGEITKATINDINKSNNGDVGSLNGYFNDDVIGYATVNDEVGVFGVYNNIDMNKSAVEIAARDEVNTGDASIYCTLYGSIPQQYSVEIKRLDRKGDDNCMIIEITDPELLEKTGGIVQGMSGSPIVQDGKLVGAVTHVLVNNVKCGYGIYIDEMLSKGEL